MYNILYYGFPAIALLYILRKYRERKWGVCSNTVRLDGKTILITGANSGIGYETAKELAKRGANIIFACRNRQLTMNAIYCIMTELKIKNQLDFVELDLTSIESIKSAVEVIKHNYQKIDILINNAGVSYGPKQKFRTKDGFEIHFGVNYLGHFVLTNSLLDIMGKDGKSRIINVSSSLHQKGQIDLDDLNLEKHISKQPYADSKLAQMYFGLELTKRVSNKNINVYNLCPGWVLTNLFRHNLFRMAFILILFLPIPFWFMRSKKQGSQTVLYCATEPKLDSETGCFYRDCSRCTSSYKFDVDKSQKLWNITENMIKKFNI